MLAAPLPKLGRNYSRFVSLMKVALPVAALALIAAVVAWPGGDTSRPGALPLSFANIKIDPTGLTMKSPRFVGVDKQGQAYTVTAEEAIQDKADAERVDLTSPEADISLKNGSWFHLQAKTGLIRPKLNTIDLDGQVELYSADGWEAHGSAVSANLDEGTARSDLPVTGQGPAGTISADRFEAWDGGNRIRFTGNVRMTVMPSARS
jgi:lipopolysaccharide export system protein LptC